MFEEKENDVIEQSNLFPKFIDKQFIKAYSLFPESLNHLKALLEDNFVLRDYTIAINYVILKVDKEIIKEVGPQILTHELKDENDLQGWLSFRYYYDDKNSLKYESSEDIIGYGFFEDEELNEDEENFDTTDEFNDSYDDEY